MISFGWRDEPVSEMRDYFRCNHDRAQFLQTHDLAGEFGPEEMGIGKRL
jgi:hypothetical protein